MTRARILAIVLAAGAVALAAAGAQATATGTLPLGTSLAGEACHGDAAPVASQPETITCGNDTEAAGEVVLAPLPQALPADASARQAAMLAAAKTLLDPATLRCDDGKPLDDSTLMFVCAVASNGWPRVVLVAGSGSMLLSAQGLPSMLPVLETALANASGRALSTPAQAAASGIVAAKFPPDLLKSGTADFSGYAKQVEVGRLAGAADDFAASEAANRNALAIETRLFGPDSVTVGETLAELALQVSNQGRFDEAAALFQRATPIIQGSSSATERARLASYLALDAANRRDFADALKFAQASSLARREEVNNAAQEAANGGPPVPAMTRGELAHSLRIEAEMALRLGDLASARAAADEALWIISEEPGLPLRWRPDAVALMAEVNAREGRVVTAERDYQDALDLDKKLFGDTAPTAQMELMAGAFYSGEQVYPAALDMYRKAFAILAKDPVARAQVEPDQIVPFITAALAADADHSLDAEIFRASQYAASDVADQTIARVAAVRASDDPALASLVAQADAAERARDAARINLAADAAKPDDERNGNDERALDAEMKAAAAQADALSAKLHASYPAYAQLADPGPAELGDVKAQLHPGEAFVSFVVGANESYALLVTPAGLTVKHLDIAGPELASEIADLRTAFVPKLGRLPEFSLKTSYGLYAKLLAPLEGDLGATDHLVVAADGDLANLPFALLVTAAPRDGAEHNYVQAAWLIRREAVTNVPSPRAWLLLRGQAHQPEAPLPFFGLGDPAFTGVAAGNGNPMAALASACVADGPVSPALLRALPPLPDTRKEVQTIGASFGASPHAILLGPAATEAALRGEDLGQYRVLYFATHGLLPGELHCQGEPALVLSPPETAPATVADDGLLYASQISAWHLNADLVVLSACNTAAAGGTRFGGGALEGLADAFFHAGARAVLASHWEVPSTSTMRLMTGVFAPADRGDGYAQALRKAQLALISQSGTAHPFHWAAFTLIGDGDASAPVNTAQRGN